MFGRHRNAFTPNLRFSFVTLGLVVSMSLGCRGEQVMDERAAVLIVTPSEPDETTARTAATMATYVERITGTTPQTIALSNADLDTLESEAQRVRAALTIVLDADALLPERFDAARLDALGPTGFALDVEDRGTFTNELRSAGSTIVLAAGATRLADQYAAYELLRRLGVRFYHPEQEHVPALPIELVREQLRDRASTPTILHRDDQDYVPDFASRSWTFHGAHPLEHLEAFSDGDFPIDEAVAVNDWIVKNKGDRFKGAGRGVASDEARARRVDELELLRTTLGFPSGPGISLHNQQQGASADIDPDSGVPVQTQIESLVTQRLADSPSAEFFGIHFGPTEVTTTPDVETVQWIDWAGRMALELRPDITVWINDHITGSQPSPNYDDLGCPNGTNGEGRIDYYDLAWHTDPRLGVSVHTVMFYPLEGPARVYEQQSFAHKLCLMEKASAAGRPLFWFPEGSWWLSFDNPIPVYLPLHMLTRARDIELVEPLLPRNGGTLRGHRMFNSGQEWGYWQQDYSVGLQSFNTEVTLDEVLGEIFDPLCDPAVWPESCDARDQAIAVLDELMQHQAELFLDAEDYAGRPGGVYAYFAGEDQADRIAAQVGFEFRPVRVDFAELLGWEQVDIDAFRASDIAKLSAAEDAYAGWLARLEALVEAVPDAGRPWLAEVIDGVEIDMLRAGQAWRLYDAVLRYREAELAGDAEPAMAAAAVMAEADDILLAAAQVIARREAAYRYPAEQMYGGGLTPETAVDNGTTYPYRVHTKTHLLTYWHNRHDEVRTILDGGALADDSAVSLTHALDLPGAALTIDWGSAQNLDGELAIGDVGTIDPSVTSFELPAGEGYYAVSGELIIDGQVLPLAGGVARAQLLATTPAGAIVATEPAEPLAQSILASVFPAMRWAWVATGADAPGLAFGSDLDEDGSIAFDDVAFGPATVMGDAFATAPVSYGLPIAISSGGLALEIGVTNMQLSGTILAGTLQSPLLLEGDLSLPDLVAALIELAGFDEEGSYQTLAPILGFDPNDPPSTVPVAAELTIE